MRKIGYLNGVFDDVARLYISPLDRGFLFADGVYEVIPVYAGKPFYLDRHLKRLRHSLSEIQLTPNNDLGGFIKDIHSQIITLIKKQIEHLPDGNLSVYLQVTRGPQPSRSHAHRTHANEPVPTPTVFMVCSPLPTTHIELGDQAEPIRVITQPDIRWQRCDIKSIALLPNIMAKQTAVDAQADETLFVRDHCIVEGSTSNVFVVRKGIVVTPPKSNHILSGITRDLVIELLTHAQIPVEEAPIPLTWLTQISEAWVASSIKEIQPIAKIDAIKLHSDGGANGITNPIYHQLARAFKALKHAR